MIKYLLIIVLYSPSSGQYKELVTIFPTLPACEAAKKLVVKELISDPLVHYAISCLEGRPTKENVV